MKGILKYYSGRLDVQDVNTFQVQQRVPTVANKKNLNIGHFLYGWVSNPATKQPEPQSLRPVLSAFGNETKSRLYDFNIV